MGAGVGRKPPPRAPLIACECWKPAGCVVGTERHEARRIDNQLRGAPVVRAILVESFFVGRRR